MSNSTAAPEVTQEAAGHFGIGTKHPGGDMTLLMIPAVPEQFDLDSLNARIDPNGYLVIDAERGESKLHLVLPADETKMTEVTMFTPQPETELQWVLHARWSGEHFTFVLNPNFMKLCQPGLALYVLTEHLAKCLTKAMIDDIARFCTSRSGYYADFGRLISELSAR